VVQRLLAQQFARQVVARFVPAQDPQKSSAQKTREMRNRIQPLERQRAR
jgi:hypothetical protein